MGINRWILASVMFLPLWVACDVERSIDVSGPTARAPTTPVAELLTAPLAVAADSTALVQGIARGLATALADSQIRSELYGALLRTRVPEGKIHLQRFLEHRGAVWGRHVSQALSLEPEHWADAVKRLGQLEMYLPVAASRSAWHGTENLLVLGLLEDDRALRAKGGAMTAYDLRGRSVSLSLQAKPAQPVLVLVPSETNFSLDGESTSSGMSSAQCDPDQQNCGGGGGGGGGGGPPVAQPGDSLILYQAQISNAGDYEGWPRGNPEIVMAVKARSSPSGTYTRILACIHEDAAAPWRFDQNNDTWSGRAFMGLRGMIQANITWDQDPMIYVWEDDNGETCDFRPDVADSLEANIVYVGGVLSTGTGIAGIVTTGSPFAWALTIASAAISAAAYNHLKSGDDFVGIATVPRNGDPNANPKTIMNKFSPQTRGRLYLQFRPNS